MNGKENRQFGGVWREGAISRGVGAPRLQENRKTDPAAHWGVGLRSMAHPTMSIDKDSTGLPEMNVHRRTTQVNLSMVIGIALFFAFTFGLVWWFWWSNR